MINSHYVQFPVEWEGVLNFLPLLLKAFEQFHFLKVIPNSIYKGEALLKSRWVFMGLRIGPKSKISENNSSPPPRKLDYNPEVSREVCFSTCDVFIENNFLHLCTSKTSADLCIILCCSFFIDFSCGIVSFIFHTFPHLRY